MNGLRLLCVVFWLAVEASLWAQPTFGVITGTVLDPDGNVLPGVVVTLFELESSSLDGQGAGPSVRSTVTDAVGGFALEGVSPDTYVVRAELFGFSPTSSTVVVGVQDRSTDLRLALTVAPVSEIVDVVPSTRAGEPMETDTFDADFMGTFQLPTDRFQEALPLLPGVIRDPKGRLSFNGTRPSQSALLVNGANATDPVTGQFAMELPLSVIDEVEVHAIPYSAEFGRVSGAVANIRTRAGGDEWDVDVGSFIPTPRFRDGTIKGFNTVTPRLRVSGPLSPGKVWISQAVSYLFTRARVKEDALPGADEQTTEAFDAFTQVDVQFDERHSMTATMSVFPSKIDHRGIDSLTPALATPDTESDGWNLAVANRLATGPDTLWETQLAARHFGVDVRPTGSGPTQLTPDGLRGNYFNAISRDSKQFELGIRRTQGLNWFGQRHLVKVGLQVMSTSFTGLDRSGPVEVRGAEGQLLRRFTFRGAGELHASDVVTSGFFQDHWRLTPRLALDLGLRIDHDAMVGESALSPRTAFALALDERGDTFLKGGVGVFFDQVFLQVDAFERFQQRVEQDFHGDSNAPVGPPVVFENRVDDDFEAPLSLVWNVEFDRRLSDALTFRVNYRENRARDRLLVNRVVRPDRAELVLSSTGHLTAREFDTTLRWLVREGSDLFVSFSKIRTDGDLNDFNLIYDTVRDPLLLANQAGHQPFDVPNRALIWGVIRLPRGFTVTPDIEWRNGFRYSVFDERYTVVGERNDSRFPSFFAADLGVTKRIRVRGREADVGIQLYNLGSHDNPRDVISNLASPRFGDLRNSVGTSLSVRFGVGL